ncbi:MAG: family 10 glycosylhydrolase [Chloroflexaceae bacterium]|jgi:uncharacterized lipoprotein YddW (UPF0748 family)|nr:family 10 glycosylhydrolase [Chloroflexaceae bacterium]
MFMRPKRPSCALLLVLLLPLLAGNTLAVPPAAAQDQPLSQMRAFWVDSSNDGFRNHPQVNELVENVVRANANTIFVQMRRHGDAWYNKTFEPRSNDPRLGPANEFDPLQYLIEKSHSMGVKVHAWLVVSVACPSGGSWQRGNPQHVCTANGPNAPGTESWTTATSTGGKVGDLDFGHPASIQYMERVVQNLLQNYPGLDGIHWDFIRFGGINYGYNQVSLDRFNLANGRPLGSRPAPTDAAWSQWRRDRITELARRLYIRSKAINPAIQVSAATITWGGAGSGGPGDWVNSAAYRQVFQDWRAWLQEGILDFAVPMHYFSASDGRASAWYAGWLNWDRQNVGRRAIVPGNGSWLNSEQEVIGQVQQALAPDAAGRSLSGTAFYSYNQPMSGSNPERRRAFMDQLRATVFSQPAVAPAWPWVVAPTTGMLQGMAAIDGQLVPDAAVSLLHEGNWLRDITASADGWYGAVELPPGSYTVVFRNPQNGRTNQVEVQVRPGLVTDGP